MQMSASVMRHRWWGSQELRAGATHSDQCHHPATTKQTTPLPP